VKRSNPRLLPHIHRITIIFVRVIKNEVNSYPYNIAVLTWRECARPISSDRW